MHVSPAKLYRDLNAAIGRQVRHYQCKLVSEIFELDQPFTTDELCRMLATKPFPVSRATIFRTLKNLVAVGMAQRQDDVYTLRF